MPNKQIAAELQLSVRTVEKHVEALLRKTGNSVTHGVGGTDGSGRPAANDALTGRPIRSPPVRLRSLTDVPSPRRERNLSLSHRFQPTTEEET